MSRSYQLQVVSLVHNRNSWNLNDCTVNLNLNQCAESTMTLTWLHHKKEVINVHLNIDIDQFLVFSDEHLIVVG